MGTTETLPVSLIRQGHRQAVIRRGDLCDLESVAPLCAALRHECGLEQRAPGQVMSWLRHQVLAWRGRLVVAQAGHEVVPDIGAVVVQGISPFQ
jgi:hypothetical protein